MLTTELNCIVCATPLMHSYMQSNCGCAHRSVGTTVDSELMRMQCTHISRAQQHGQIERVKMSNTSSCEQA